MSKEITLYRPNGKGTGAKARFATETDGGLLSIELTPQKTVASLSDGTTRSFPTFDTTRKSRITLQALDLAEMLMVLRGERESIADGKGIYVIKQGVTCCLQFSHVIEPRCGYNLTVATSFADGIAYRNSIFLGMSEALFLSLAIEGLLKSQLTDGSGDADHRQNRFRYATKDEAFKAWGGSALDAAGQVFTWMYETE